MISFTGSPTGRLPVMGRTAVLMISMSTRFRIVVANTNVQPTKSVDIVVAIPTDEEVDSTVGIEDRENGNQPTENE